jgi:hypothetical protein
MLRKEIDERIGWLEEQTHRLVALLVVFVLVSPVIGHFADSVSKTGETIPRESHLHEWLERLHIVVNAADVLIAILLFTALFYRHLFIRPDNVEWSGALNDQELQHALKGLFDRSDVDTIIPNVRYSDSSTINELTEMNYEAFKAGRFGIEKEKLFRRNRHYQAKNARIFLFIDSPFEAGKHIGYSAMVPLTEEGRESYLDGALKDADIPVSLIAEDRHHAAAVLVFAMHLLPVYSFVKNAAARDFSHYFLACVRHHAWSLFSPDGPGEDYPPLYVQTGVSSLRRRMLKQWHFVSSHRRSADGCEILVLEQPFRSGLPAKAELDHHAAKAT